MPDKDTVETVDQESVTPSEATKANEDPDILGTETAAPEITLEKLQQELHQARTKSEENWNNLLRARADLENLRKRSQRDLENAHKYSVERFAAELLPVKDSLELGLDHSNEEVNAKKLHEGMELTLKMLKQLMEKFRIDEIDPQGEVFDPERHQAMTIQENAELAPNTVITVMQKGYMLNDRLLRPAMVIVSKHPEDST